MATIDATVGGADANSYATLAEANTYFLSRPHSDIWNNEVDNDVLNNALIHATRRINQEKYIGQRGSSTQRLVFPRDNIEFDGIDLSGTIPRQIKEAQFETAIFILENDPNKKDTNIGAVKKSTVKVGTLEESTEYVQNSNVSVPSSFDLPDWVEGLISDFKLSGGNSIYWSR